MTQRYLIPSLVRAVQVMDLLAREQRGLTLAELGRLSGVPKSTLFRILTTLRHHQCVQWSEEDRCFRLGSHVWELGSSFLDSCEPYRVAERHLKRLAEATGETVFMARLEADSMIYLRRVDGTKAVAMMRNLGQRTPVYCTASGRAVLAFLNEADADSVLDGQRMEAYTDRTITDRAALKAVLAEVRRQGYAVVDAEYNRDLLCISAPVFDHQERPCAAVTLAMLSPQRTRANLVQQYAALVRESAAAFSRDVGCLRYRAA